MIKIDKLNKYYGGRGASQVHAVNDVSLTLPDSGMVAIFGKSGCGKTTLLNMVGGLDKASSGEVLIDGKKITPDSDSARNLKVGYIFQNYNLSERMSVYDNVAVSLRLCGMTDEAEIEARVLAALRSVDMEKYRKRLPTALSGGQQQRVAIARAIVKNPSLILADEPTGNLDEQNTVMVMDLLKSLSRDRLVLLVTHEAHLVDSYCDKVIGLSDGKIFEERENSVTEGYIGKKANEVYLGDMERDELSDGELTFEYYGDRENKPTKLRIISAGGVLYISASDDVKLKIADKSSELIVHEGKYTEKPKSEPKELPPELKAPIHEGKSGRLYNFKGALKSGFNSNFAKKRKRKILLILTMMCFAAIIVFVVGLFGAAIYNFSTVEQYFNSNVVGVSANEMTNDEAREVVSRGDAELFVISGSFRDYSPNVHDYLNFSFGSYDTASYGIRYDNAGSENVQALPISLLEGRRLLAGSDEIKAENEIIITAAVADTIIKAMGNSNINSYDDLVHANVSRGGRYGYYYDGMDMISPGGRVQNSKLKVVGVVSGSDEEAFYHEYTYLQKTLTDLYGVNAGYFSDLEHSGFDLPELESGSVYTLEGYTYGGYEKTVIGGQSYKIVETYTVEITDEQLGKHCKDYYGYDLTEGVEAYLRYYYGLNSYEDWAASYYGKEGLSKEEAKSLLESEYQSFLERAKMECLQRAGSNVPQVIMTLDDMKRVATSYSVGKDSEGLTSGIYQGGTYVFYSNDAKALGESMIDKYGEDNVTTPKSSRDYLRAEYYGTFVSLTVVLIVVSAIMSLCLYFIMRSSLMGDIKEVGISRAIGVSKRNLSYRYLIETLMLFVMTIFVGFLLSSILMGMLTNLPASMGMIVYYPWWLGIITLIGIIFITVICGQMPIRSLLRRSPAEILAKYDI